MKKLRVLLVDDEIIIREGFKRLFDWDAHDCEVAGEAADGNLWAYAAHVSTDWRWNGWACPCS